MTPLETCLYWKSHSISTVPLYFRSKVPHKEALIQSGFIKSDGKATWLPLKEQPASTEQIKAWCQYKINLALVTTDKLIVLDFDDMQDYAYWHLVQAEHNPDILNTYRVLTARGLHLYYWIVEPFPAVRGGQYEVKSHGAMVNIPPSTHPSGKLYRPLGHPDDIKSMVSIEETLTFCPVKYERSLLASCPWKPIITENGTYQRVNLLDLFPDAKPTKDEGYYLANCPFHGHKKNFMLNVPDGIGYCYAGCGTFLASELSNLVKQGKHG
jgi:hypothetical protein